MAEIPRFLLRHTVTVEPRTGSGAYGDTYGDAVPVRCFRDEKRRLVRSLDGNQVVSETTLYCRLTHDTDFPADSRVTWDGRTSYVITAARHDDADLGAWQHLEVNLT